MEFKDINKAELTRAERIIYLEVGKLQEKIMYHEQFIFELKKDMANLIKIVKEIKEK